MPTVRALAGELTVAPNTVVKAYNELQREGLILSRAGVGTVVVGEAEEAVRRRKLEELYGRVGLLVRDAAGLGVAEEELRERFDRELEQTFKSVADRGGA